MEAGSAASAVEFPTASAVEFPAALAAPVSEGPEERAPESRSPRRSATSVRLQGSTPESVAPRAGSRSEEMKGVMVDAAYLRTAPAGLKMAQLVSKQTRCIE